MSFRGTEAMDGNRVKHKVEHFKEFLRGVWKDIRKRFLCHTSLLFSLLVSDDVKKGRGRY